MDNQTSAMLVWWMVNIYVIDHQTSSGCSWGRAFVWRWLLESVAGHQIYVSPRAGHVVVIIQFHQMLIHEQHNDLLIYLILSHVLRAYKHPKHLAKFFFHRQQQQLFGNWCWPGCGSKSSPKPFWIVWYQHCIDPCPNDWLVNNIRVWLIVVVGE